MRPSTAKPDELDLDLPAVDGENEDGVVDPSVEVPDVADDVGDAFDDSTGEDSPIGDMSFDGAEGGWLVDAEDAGALDVGPFDVVIEPEGRGLDDGEGDARHGLEDLVSADESFVADGGEEGPLADDEELREEDLPALDADDDGDVPDEDLYDRAVIAPTEELRWADRAWARATDVASALPGEEIDDSGLLVGPGDDASQSIRDSVWKHFEANGNVMAASVLPGGSVVLAIGTADRCRATLVRIQPNGEARIIAEIDPSVLGSEDDGEACLVTFMRWDASRSCLFVGGSFGVGAYRPT